MMGGKEESNADMASGALHVLAVDYGASGGRGMLGSYDGGRLAIRDIHRFENEPVYMLRGLHWDFPRLLLELKRCIRRFHAETDGRTLSLAVDTWGVDFGLLDRSGQLLGNPFHYRDGRTDGIMEASERRITRTRLYAATGIEPMQINTVYQLYSMIRQRSPLLESAETLLFTPDLFQYFLTGEKAAEYSIASTSALLDARAQTWSGEVLGALAIPRKLLAPVVMPGSTLGALHGEVRRELGVGGVKVINVGSHDTASAVAAAPAATADFAYISTGTWSLMGVETAEPLINAGSERLAFTNEGGVGGKIRLQKNIMGLWLLQETRRQWANEGAAYSYEQLQALAAAEQGHACFIDPADQRFLTPGDMPSRIRAYCRETGQPEPLTHGQLVRCVVDSLALAYRRTLSELELLLQRRLPVIHMVGGGIQNKLLCQLTADATGREVTAGPVEATAVGNMLVQLMAHGELGSVGELREVVRASFPPVVYEPQDGARWEEAYWRFLHLAP